MRRIRDVEHDRGKRSQRTFDLAGHLGELEADDLVVDEALAERAPLHRVLDRLFVAHPRLPARA